MLKFLVFMSELLLVTEGHGDTGAYLYGDKGNRNRCKSFYHQFVYVFHHKKG